MACYYSKCSSNCLEKANVRFSGSQIEGKIGFQSPAAAQEQVARLNFRGLFQLGASFLFFLALMLQAIFVMCLLQRDQVYYITAWDPVLSCVSFLQYVSPASGQKVILMHNSKYPGTAQSFHSLIVASDLCHT